MPDPNCSANVVVKNNAATVADISICHYIGGDSTVTSKTWKGVQPGAATTDPFVVHYVLHDRNLDYWYCELTTNQVLYYTVGGELVAAQQGVHAGRGRQRTNSPLRGKHH